MPSSRRHGARTNAPKWRAIASSTPSSVSTASPTAPGWCTSGGNHRGWLCRRRRSAAPAVASTAYAVLNRRPDENWRNGCVRRIPATPTRTLQRAGRLWRSRPDQSRHDKGRSQFDGSPARRPLDVRSRCLPTARELNCDSLKRGELDPVRGQTMITRESYPRARQSGLRVKASNTTPGLPRWLLRRPISPV